MMNARQYLRTIRQKKLQLDELEFDQYMLEKQGDMRQKPRKRL